MVSCKLLISCLAVCVAATGVAGFSGGPPASSNPDLVCREMAPNPQFHGDPQTTGNGGYVLDISPPMNVLANGFTYVPNTEYIHSGADRNYFYVSP